MFWLVGCPSLRSRGLAGLGTTSNCSKSLTLFVSSILIVIVARNRPLRSPRLRPVAAAATGISNGVGGFNFTSLLWSPGFTAINVADYTGDGKADVTQYN